MTCSECGTELQVGDWPFCGGDANRHLPTNGRFAQGFDPIVVHKDAQGNIRFPAHVNAPIPEGFQRVELRTTHDVRRFEAEVNTSERAKADQSLSARERAFSERQSENRRELRSRMGNMSQFGRDFARLAMDRTNNRRPQSRDVGFHVDVFSNNSSNR